MQKKTIALAVAGLDFASSAATPIRAWSNLGTEGPADFLNPRPFGHKEKPWGKKNRRKLGGMKGARK